MVLSNKKLKQKLRAVLAESLTESEAQKHQTNKDSTCPETHKQSFSSLLDSATQKPRLSKRGKRREKTQPLHGADDSGPKKENQEGGDEEKRKKKKKKKKKRKRDGNGGDRLENGGSENVEAKKKKGKMVENVEVKEGLESEIGSKDDGDEEKRKRGGDGGDGPENGGSENVEANKKKNKKKKKKKGKKVENEEVKESSESEVGISGEQSLAERIVINESPEKVDVSTKVYVGGIPYYSTEDDIRSFFEGCGSITEVDCMTFPESGKFRGIAIISFKTEAAAKRALAFNGADMGGLFLKIQPYKTKGDDKVSDFSPAIVEGYNRIYVGNLSWDITEDELRKLFLDCSISSIRFGEDRETGEFRGYAHVDFADILSITMALKLDQKIVCGRPVRIRCAVPKKTAETNSKSVQTSKKADNDGAETTSKYVQPIKEYDNGEVSAETNSKSVQTSKEADNGGVSSISGKIRRRTCYECGERGHLSSSCQKKQTTEQLNSGAT